LKTLFHFDSRVILLGKRISIISYMRQAETWRNHMSSYGYYTLIKSGMSENEAATHLKNMKASEITSLYSNTA